ncbi:helix-turn-helix domain-containing protein [Streptomyces prunicolor]|uniref:helix-turn-helix domain-containing protein n=1 Tax=Streptomyces prunicolor TaxID=67348 RepID=UPI00037B7EC3|nr:helix-turn-helix domain-containing protein [Streptomyces prunicolor]
MSTISRGTRRIIVAHLTDRGMTPAEIAAELGVSDDTVRRDIREWTPPAPAAEPEDAAPPAPGLLLPESTQLRQDLNLLADSYKAQREDVAKFAIHVAAEGIRRRMHARFAADDRQEVRS